MEIPVKVWLVSGRLVDLTERADASFTHLCGKQERTVAPLHEAVITSLILEGFDEMISAHGLSGIWCWPTKGYAFQLLSQADLTLMEQDALRTMLSKLAATGSCDETHSIKIVVHLQNNVSPYDLGRLQRRPVALRDRSDALLQVTRLAARSMLSTLLSRTTEVAAASAAASVRVPMPPPPASVRVPLPPPPYGSAMEDLTRARSKPAEKDAKDQRAEKDAKDQPADKAAKGQPAEKDAKGQPADKDATGKPAEEDAKDQPADKDAKGKPAEEDAKDQPADKDAKGKPAEEDAKGERAEKDAKGQRAEKDAKGQRAEKPEKHAQGAHTKASPVGQKRKQWH